MLSHLATCSGSRQAKHVGDRLKVKVQSSPDDPLLHEDWPKRLHIHVGDRLHESSDWGRQQGKNYWAKGSKKDKLAKYQNWKCPVCGDSLFNSEEIETHHIVPVAEGGTDDIKNLMHLHRACLIHVALAKSVLAKATSESSDWGRQQVHSKSQNCMAGSKARAV